MHMYSICIYVYKTTTYLCPTNTHIDLIIAQLAQINEKYGLRREFYINKRGLVQL